ncbi:hypothetical protein ABLU56_13195 [Klebsiella sp. GN_Kp186]|uniref:hypothetical protein n=1 Tax=Klebsiella TaxID=570 RepID=UPI0007B3D9CD|nr:MULTISPECIES: hypothetical protein [Klebsiella]EKU3965340.1 hypothetical protein [Klebsiella pneumoniae]KZQ53577.1 hypothetical protein A3N43_12770 [Klebsiella aerogenes]MCB8427630.1 hypothetical protein [Klebsiella pneumoniae]MCB8462975.1 hypothetical protein [Klebsiella pneumoniae]QIH94078.1 hypothetical protein EJB20_22970 [Klebsiella pneumoniae]
MATLLTTGLTVQDYYKNGGVLEFELDALEVGGNSTEFETFQGLKKYLNKGFQLPPTVIIQDKEVLALILNYGDFWTKIHAYTYAQGGTVTYKQLPSGQYYARCEWN